MLVPSIVFAALALLVLRGLFPHVFRGRALAITAGLATFAMLIFVGSRLEFLPAELTAVGIAWSVASIVVVLLGLPLLLARGSWGVAKRITGRIANRVPAPSTPAALAAPDLGRRRFFAGVLPATALAAGAKGSASGLVSEFVVKHEEFVVPNLPAELDGFKIGQTTDVHVGDFIDADYLGRAVRALDDANVDLHVMTGDLIDDLDQLEATLDALESNRAPHGMLAVLGNHEKWRGEERIVDAYSKRRVERVRLLIDESVTIDHRGGSLRVVGVDWPSVGTRRRIPREERDDRMLRSAQKAFAGVSGDEAVLCLSHHPDFFPHAVERGACLTLAGHTHGGQVALLGVPVFRAAFVHMLGRYERDEKHLYVGGGTGHWMPFRIGVPAEVTVITLRRKQA